MRNDFIFDGKYGSDFGLKFCNIDGNGDSETIIISNTEIETFRPANSDKDYFISGHYTSVLSKKVQVCKIENCNVVTFTNSDVEEIARWLCRNDGYHKFAFINDEDIIEYNAKIDVNTIEINEQIAVLELTITTDSQFGYTPKTNHFVLSANDTVYIIDNSSKTGETPVNLKLVCKRKVNF